MTGNPKSFQKVAEGDGFLGATQQKLREILAEVRNEDGTLPPEYSGYNSDFTRIQTIIGDLAKVAPMFTDDEE